jgi:nitrate/TMAO reductase-like tetraheme cytochrome c subunit
MYSKEFQTRKNRVKKTQKQRGAITKKVREEVEERSSGVCERCYSARALQMAHLVSRKQVIEETTAEILLHVCVSCHKWLDETPEGIQYKRSLQK